MTDRSLLTEVDDDGVTLPRWGHYLLKLATGMLTLLVAMAALSLLPGDASEARDLLAAALSVAWFLSLRVDYWLEHKGDTPPDTFFKPDLWCDLSLHAAAIVALLAAEWQWIAALALFASCLRGFWHNYPGATP